MLVWTVCSLASARRQLRGGAKTVVLPAPAQAAVTWTRWVRAISRRAPVTCLAESYVLQHWYLALGEPRDVVVAVTPPSHGFKAHAWLDGDPAPSGFFEFTRRLPPPPG